MRDILKQQILYNSDQLIKDLIKFIKPIEKEDRVEKFDGVPKYEKPLQDVVKYRFIEEEVRCGQYYLRVWTQKKWSEQEFFQIPHEEEEDFLINLKISINSIIMKEKGNEIGQ